MALVPTTLVCERRSKRRTISRWRTTFPVPPQFAQRTLFAPWQASQTRFPLPQVQSTSPFTQSGQGIVRPLLAGSVSTGLGIGTPCERIPSNTSATLSLTEVARFSARFLKNDFFCFSAQSDT